MYSSLGTCGTCIHPIAVAMSKSAKKLKNQKIKGKEQIIADWINDEIQLPKVKKNRVDCEITDNEARAVQHLILDLKGQSEILDDWMDAIIDRYFYGKSWPQMVRYESRENKDGIIEKVKIYSEWDARFDVKCGLAAMHVRYPFIDF